VVWLCRHPDRVKPRAIAARQDVAAEGAHVLRCGCLSCHGEDLIASQTLNEIGWGREVDKMVRWGAVVSDTERTALVAT
jgi:hypothetical protein